MDLQTLQNKLVEASTKWIPNFLLPLTRLQPIAIIGDGTLLYTVASITETLAPLIDVMYTNHAKATTINVDTQNQ